MRPSILIAVLGFLSAPLLGQDNALRKQRLTVMEPFVRKWCAKCHSGNEPEADLDLVAVFGKPIAGEQALATIIDVEDLLKAGEMPPEDAPKPPKADVARVRTWLGHTLDAAARNVDPGRVTMRRLSRFEYRNSIRDLFGVTEDVTKGFPVDDLGYGFDNIGDALSMSALRLEKYAAAARRVSELAIVAEDPDHPPKRLYDLEDIAGASKRLRVVNGYVVFISRATVAIPTALPRAGRYRVVVRAYGQQAGNEPVKIGVRVDNNRRWTIEVRNERDHPGTFARDLVLPGGTVELAFEFLNDYYKPAKNGRHGEDRNLWIDFVKVIGPIDPPVLPASHKWIFVGDRPRAKPAERARPLLSRLMRRAWRRPVKRSEVARLTKLVEAAVGAGDTFEQGMQLALSAVLVSPNFLYRIEPASKHASGIELLGDYEMASRLSFFLWSSVPDPRLLDLAERGFLSDPAFLMAEAKRMLADPRADALADNFAVQWLELRMLEDAMPDPDRFPAWSPELRDAMLRESTLFFRSVLREKRSVFTLIDADYTFVNERLARHYGFSGVTGDEFRRVELKAPRRGGVITQASVQTVTSNPTRTSPVKRGKWILENVLDAATPPPPPGVSAFPDGVDVSVAATLREQLAVHREKASCAVCHNRMDPLGLALENYDAIGRWRDSDNGHPIDASGQLPSGVALDGPASLKKVLRRGDGFVRCLTKKLFLYAIGREITTADELAIDRLVRSLPKSPTLEDMILGVIGLDAFRKRRARG